MKTVIEGDQEFHPIHLVIENPLELWIVSQLGNLNFALITADGVMLSDLQKTVWGKEHAASMLLGDLQLVRNQLYHNLADQLQRYGLVPDAE